jgi:hypothetical protein
MRLIEVTQPDTPPEINYLAKDYASFRQLLLDQLSLWLPEWTEEHPADLGHAIMDVLAYAADYLSYYQDAVATEAYLGTARLRRSVKRHVRLLDYRLHEGCNARVWVQVQVKDDEILLPRGTQLFTRLDEGATGTVIQRDSPAYHEALGRTPVVFETMMDSMLHRAHNEIEFPPPGPQATQRMECLKAGATSAVLHDPEKKLKLQVGDVLIFQEIRNPEPGLEADPKRRHALRLTRVTPTLDGEIRIGWGADDALPFELCLWARYDGITPVKTSVALGNIVLADHGRTIEDEELPGSPRAGRHSPHLRHEGLTFSEPFHLGRSAIWSAKEMLSQKPHRAMPWLALCELGTTPLPGNGRSLLPLEEHGERFYPVKHWTVRLELISSGTYERDYTVEIEDDGRTYLRFGRPGVGWRPEVVGAPFVATYRIGNGSAGNVGRDTIAHIVTANKRITGVRNPLPAQGGTEPVNTEEARRHAPPANRASRPCVTEADYREAAEHHPQVARAVAQIRWAGDRRTAFIYVQRRHLGHRPVEVDEEFRRELAGFMEAFRMAGCDLEIRGARIVPLEIELDVYLQPRHQASIVRAALHEAFSDRTLPDEKVGFFHPDHWTFGQPVYQSQVIARAMAVPGVAQVEVRRFRRRGADRDDDPILVGPLEIVRLHNDPSDPGQGTIKFTKR